jgi:hypothetical protein
MVLPEAWVEQWAAAHPVTFASARLRAAWVRAVVRGSGGVPAAVQGLLDLTLAERTVERALLRKLEHAAAVTYLDMTPLVILAAAGFMALRYVSRGVSMPELMVFAGVGTALFWVVLYFARLMGGKR